MSNKRFEGDYIGEMLDRLQEKQDRDLREREVSADETSASEAKKANEIAIKALKESKKARNEARLSYAIAGVSLLVTILALFF